MLTFHRARERYRVVAGMWSHKSVIIPLVHDGDGRVSQVARRDGQARPLILVADVNPRSAEMTASHLRYHLQQVDVMTASSCGEARGLAREHDVSLLIVDLDLPDGRGDELLAELLALSENARGILTGRALAANLPAEQFLGYLPKPLSVDELVDLAVVVTHDYLEP